MSSLLLFSCQTLHQSKPVRSQKCPRSVQVRILGQRVEWERENGGAKKTSRPQTYKLSSQCLCSRHAPWESMEPQQAPSTTWCQSFLAVPFLSQPCILFLTAWLDTIKYGFSDSFFFLPPRLTSATTYWPKHKLCWHLQPGFGKPCRFGSHSIALGQWLAKIEPSEALVKRLLLGPAPQSLIP